MTLRVRPPHPGIIQLVKRGSSSSQTAWAGQIFTLNLARIKDPGIVRVRVDGICREILKVPAEHTGALDSPNQGNVQTGYFRTTPCRRMVNVS